VPSPELLLENVEIERTRTNRKHQDLVEKFMKTSKAQKGCYCCKCLPALSAIASGEVDLNNHVQRKKIVKVPKKLRKLLKKQRKEAKKLKDEQVFYCKLTICQSDVIKVGKGKRYSATIKFSQSAG
jgi:hypothetical protein